MRRTRAKTLTKNDKGMKTVQSFSTTEQNRTEQKREKNEEKGERERQSIIVENASDRVDGDL